MYYKYCKSCRRYSYGKPYCYNCYKKLIKENNEKENVDNYNYNENFISNIKYNLNLDLNFNLDLNMNFNLDYNNNEDYNDNSDKEETKCIYCGENSNGYTLCYNCYQKYKLIPSKNKSTLKLSGYDKYQSKNYECKNGILVRSKSELIISNFLTDKHISHEYEKHISTDGDPTNDIKPDFYIPKLRINGRVLYDVYIEHFGGANTGNYSDQKRYKESVKYKIPIYRKKHITLICTYEEDISNIDKVLIEKLSNCKINQINYLKQEYL